MHKLQVEGQDKTDEFCISLRNDIDSAVTRRDFILDKGHYKGADFDILVRQWQDKLHRCEIQDQTWGVFTAKRLFD